MTITTVPVTCSATRPDGSVIAGGLFRFLLSHADTQSGLIVPRDISVAADSAGTAIAQLWPNGLGAAGTTYRVFVSDPLGGITDLGTCTVPNAACALYQILDLGAPATIDAATLAKIAAQAAAADAGNSASAAHADRVLADSDVQATHADVALTHLDATQTGNDRISTTASALTATNNSAIAVNKAGEASASSTSAIAAQQAAEAAKNSAVAVVTGGTASLAPAAGKIPIADADGRIMADWIRQQTNDVGQPGTLGFGVGIAPSVPSGYSVMVGTTTLGHDNYGNYQYSDGSIMVWIPRCWFSYDGSGTVTVKPAAYFKDEATANAAGYFSHRADWDAGLLMPGQMVDKYHVSNNAGVGSSIKNAMPLVSGPAAGQLGFNALTGAPANAYYGAIAASKTRGAQFFCASRFIYAKLAMLALAHAQASSNTTYNAWYGATTNFPKGNNGNNLKDVNDAAVTYTTAGASSYPNFALTGSGAPFNKTTHNGQNCGIADLNGNIYSISLGMTCIAVGKTITAATQANPVQITAVAHGFATGDVIQIESVVGMTQLNSRMYRVTVTGTDTFTLNACDGTAFTAYTSGGAATRGKWYAAKKSVAMKDFTAGATIATDHWGATGVAAMMDEVIPDFRIDYPNNSYTQRYGNGAGLVLSNVASGNDWVMTGLGMPQDTGISVSGSNAYGQDYYYQYVRDQLCVLSGGYWVNGSFAGVWVADLNNFRSNSNSVVGLRSASYPVAP